MLRQSIGSFCWDPCEVGSRCLSRLQIFTPVCVQWRCVDLSVLDTPHRSPPFSGVQTHLRKVLLSRWTAVQAGSPSSLWEQFLQGGAVQSAARHGQCFYPKPWDGSLLFVKSVLPGVKNETKQWGIKWKGLGGRVVCHIVCLHPHHLCRNDPAWQRKSPRLWSEFVKACVCTCVCMHVCKLNMHTRLCVYLLLFLELSRETLNALTNVYIYYILSWATSWEYPHHDLKKWNKKIPQIKTAEV